MYPERDDKDRGKKTIKWKGFLSRPAVSVLIVLLAIAGRVIMQFYFYDDNGDRSYQLVAARNFVNGHGLTVNRVFSGDLQAVDFRTLPEWPPGYPLLLSLFLPLTHHDFKMAALFLDLLSMALLVIYARKTLQLLSIPTWLVNLFTLVAGFFIYEFSIASTSDLNTVSFFMVAVYAALLFLKKEKKPTFGACIGLLLFLCPFIRYMYIPIVLAVPCYLIWVGYITRNKRMLGGGLYCLLTLALGLAALLAYQYNNAGTPLYIMPFKKGFFPENLIYMHPFLVTPFFDLMFFWVSMSRVFGMDFLSQVSFARLAHLFPFLLLFGWSFYFLWKNRARQKSITGHFIYLGLLCSVCNVSLLVFLSATRSSFLDASHSIWTFSQEARYYAFPVVFLQLLTFVYLSGYFSKKGRPAKIISLSFSILFGLQLLHGAYFILKIVLTERQQFTFNKQKANVEVYANGLIQELKQKEPGKNIVFTSTNTTFINLASLRGCEGFYTVNELNQPHSLRAKSATVMIAALDGQTINRFLPFSQYDRTKFIGQAAGYYFYTLDVPASSPY